MLRMYCRAAELFVGNAGRREAQDALVDLSGLLARAYDFDHVTEWRDDEHLDGLRRYWPANDDA
jgi:hypothetical protein